ncbi:MAG TPA: hypothetical protein VMU60_11155 [Syntrophobacteria bacterium]|nr:hypothetical protein [Syntrophobacteria bacterium]
MTTAAPRCLVIGSKGHLNAKCVDWQGEPLPVLPDYDVAIINVRSLTQEALTRIPYVRLKEICLALMRLLESKGQVVVLSDFHRTVPSEGKQPELRDENAANRPGKVTRPQQQELRTISNYSWAPINIQLFEETGETIKICHNSYKNYFAKFKEMSQWQYYFLENQQGLSLEALAHYMQKYPSLRYKVHFEPLIENRYDKALAVRFHYEVSQPESAKTDYSQKTTEEEKPRLVSGSFAVLPLLSNLEDREAITVLLQDLTGAPQESEPPGWAQNIPMPGIARLDKEIQVNRTKIKYMKRVIGNLENSKTELEQYKKILYTSGSELERTFDLFATKLGATLQKSKYANEERFIEYGNDKLLVYIKARETAISLTDLRILNDHLLHHEEDTKTRIKGVLLGNAWKNLPIAKRDSQEMPYFPESVLERAKQFEIALVSSGDFFHAFCTFIEKAEVAAVIFDSMMRQTGRVNFTQVLRMGGAGGRVDWSQPRHAGDGKEDAL